MQGLTGSVHGSPLSPAGTFAIAAPVFALLLTIAALTSMNWINLGTHGCGVFRCCSATLKECKQVTDVDGLWSVIVDRLNATGAFLLIAVFFLVVAVVLTVVAAHRKWAGMVSVVAAIITFCGAALLWIALYIASGMPGSITASPQWLTLWAALAALGGGFFALHAAGHAVVWLSLQQKPAPPQPSAQPLLNQQAGSGAAVAVPVQPVQPVQPQPAYPPYATQQYAAQPYPQEGPYSVPPYGAPAQAPKADQTVPPATAAQGGAHEKK